MKKQKQKNLLDKLKEDKELVGIAKVFGVMVGMLGTIKLIKGLHK